MRAWLFLIPSGETALCCAVLHCKMQSAYMRQLHNSMPCSFCCSCLASNWLSLFLPSSPPPLSPSPSIIFLHPLFSLESSEAIRNLFPCLRNSYFLLTLVPSCSYPVRILWWSALVGCNATTPRHTQTTSRIQSLPIRPQQHGREAPPPSPVPSDVFVHDSTFSTKLAHA